MNFEEGFLRFQFDENYWHVIQLDRHSGYRNQLGKLNGTKAVDFIGVFNNEILYLIEVKDFRGHRIENKDRLRRNELALELGQKVRDSLACIISAYRTSSQPDIWRPFIQPLNNRRLPIKVVLWLEHDLLAHPVQQQEIQLSTRIQIFKNKLKWLTSTVAIGNHRQNVLPHVQVDNLKRS